MSDPCIKTENGPSVKDAPRTVSRPIDPKTAAFMLRELKKISDTVKQITQVQQSIKADNERFKKKMALSDERLKNQMALLNARLDAKQKANSNLMKKVSANDVAPLTDQTAVFTETTQTDSTEKVTVFAPQNQKEDAAIADIESVVQHEDEGSNDPATETIEIEQTKLAPKTPVNPTNAKVIATYANVNGINAKVHPSKPTEIQVDATEATVHATANIVEVIQGIHIPLEAEPPPMTSPYAKCLYQDDSYQENTPIVKFFQAWHSPLWIY